MGSNDRQYYSQGIQVKTSISTETGPIAHEIDLGLRIHRDQVERNHNEVIASMVSGDLQYQEGSYRLTNTNRDTSNAIAVYAQDELMWGNFSTKIGARLEQVEHERNPRNGAVLQQNTERVFVPGIGFNYSLTEDMVLLAGVNKGVTLVGPGQADSIAPEESTNYEIGFRVKAPVYFEVIGFYSDYQNLKGNCSFSTGCDEANLDTEFNGGAAEIYGLESAARHEFKVGEVFIPVRMGYTYTVARFKNEFFNTNPEWGPRNGPGNLIRVDDPLPYIPQYQISFGTGASYKKLSFDLNLVWKDQVVDQAVAQGRRIIPSYGVIDTALGYQYARDGKGFIRVNNLLDNTYLTSLRPFGLRPGSPRTIVAGVTQGF